jgi:SpoVK/Ycf46/Vps4 family AAA+-type ATPase
LKNSAGESRDKHENEEDMLVEIEDEPSQKVEDSTNVGSPRKEGSDKRSLNCESSSEGSSNTEATDVPEKSGGNVVSTAPCTDKGNEIVELTGWLHENQCPISDQQLEELHVELDDFRQALKSVQPSSKREGFATVPDVTWEDVGSLRNIREELQMSILVS